MEMKRSEELQNQGDGQVGSPLSRIRSLLFR